MVISSPFKLVCSANQSVSLYAWAQCLFEVDVRPGRYSLKTTWARRTRRDRFPT